MASVTKTELLLEAAMAAHAGDPERATALERARRFKRSWIDLAEILCHVRDGELYLRWGHPSFHDYCARELHLKRGTVDKLCASYGFLQANAPRLVRGGRGPEREREREPEDEVGDAGPVPSWQAVDYVARATERGAADEATLAEMRRAVFEEGAPMPTLARRYREVAFPMADDEKRARLRAQLVTTARRLAALVVEPEAGVPDALAARVEGALGELTQALDGAGDRAAA